MGTVLVLAILIVIVGCIIRSMIKDKKAGKSLQYGGNCKTVTVAVIKCHGR